MIKILKWVQCRGGKDMLTVSVVLWPDIISLLWLLIGPCVTPHSYIIIYFFKLKLPYFYVYMSSYLLCGDLIQDISKETERFALKC